MYGSRYPGFGNASTDAVETPINYRLLVPEAVAYRVLSPEFRKLNVFKSV